MADQDGPHSEMITQLLRHVASSPHDADVKGDIFRRTIYPPSLVVIAFISSVLRGGAESVPPGRREEQLMLDAGIDATIFKPHSTRSAATSAAKLASVPLDEVMATAGWRSSSVFAVCYHKLMESDGPFVNGVLGHV